MGDRRRLTHAAAGRDRRIGIPPLFPGSGLARPSVPIRYGPLRDHARTALDDIFFWLLPEFIGELLLNYFFVIWLDRHA
ncbi:hypothetical protein [Burkholderia sp. S-53]|uniref:hypothetical protein n=1 Tax=Burkholderia sp. S-53 TaxID=2906514 RepID=UPI0021D17EDD|nr:hypothetical protein [Burkholderia sp. S-53]UXU91572.1 hypothetical protein LXM88_25750 [Burkholderia sp. S-53]